MEPRENTISMLVNNKPDVLARIAGTLSGRGFNIESISANITKDPKITKIIITTIGSKATVTRIVKQLDNIVDVLQVDNMTGKLAVRRELTLFRLNWSDGHKVKITQAVDENKWRIVCADDEYCIIEVSGKKEEIDRAITILDPLGMDDFSRSGTVALEKRKP